MVGYLFGGNTGVSYQDLQSRREAADALAKRIMGMQPKNVPEGIGALLMGAASGIGRWRADKGLREGREAASTQFDSILGRILGGSNPSSSNSSAASSMPTTTDAGNEMAATSPSVAGGPEAYRNAIASIESAGSGDYAAVGPTHPKLGRALGRYQIMEANIGPWSQEALGRAVTPEEFMADPKLQDAIFDKKFGGYVQQYGPEGAAQAWIGGPGGVGKLGRKDSLGTSVGAYGSKFLNALGPQAAAATPASAAVDAQAPASGYVDPMVSAPNFQQPANQMTPQLQNPAQAANLPIQNPVQPGSLPLPQQQAAALPPLPSRDVAAAPPVASVPPKQMAQAAPPQMPRAQPYRPDPEMLKLLSNPFLDEGQKGALRLVMQQQMQQHQADQEQQIWQARQDYETQQRRSDPAYQLGLEQTRVETDRLRQGTRPITPDERKAWGIPETDTRPYAMTADGPKMVGGGGQTINFRTEIDARRQAATEMGIDPNSEEGKRYILTGSLPAGDRGVTAGDREAIRDADDQAQAARSAIDQLQSVINPGPNNGPALNDRAGSGALADWQSWAARNDPTGFFDDKKGEATTELSNTVLGQALGSLKSIFGAAPTEGERQILLDMQASVDKTPAERKIIIDKAIALANRRLQFNQDRANDLRGGSYYKPERGAPNVQTNPPRTPAEATGLPPAPSGSVGPQPGDIEDGYRFKGGNPSDPNNWEQVQ